MSTRKTERGITPLHLAIANNPNVEVPKYLIAKGVDVNMVPDLYTPLSCALMRNSIEVLKDLIEKGVDVNAKNRYGDTPLDCARTDEMKTFLRLAGGKSGKDLP